MCFVLLDELLTNNKSATYRVCLPTAVKRVFSDLLTLGK